MPHGQLRRSIVSVSVTAALVLGGLLVSPLPASATDDPGDVTPNVQPQDDAEKVLQTQNDTDSVLTPLAGSVSALAGPVTTSFHADEIISDSNFFGSSMTESAVQAFLVGEVPTCRDAQHTCLKDYHQSTTTIAADPMCAEYVGGTNEPAARIIAKVGQACGISQKVILTLLQKESSIVDDTWPTPNQYARATGYACPDTGDCDPDYAGFFDQVYWAAWQYKRYSNPPGSGAPFNSFPVGQPSTVAYNPTGTCGGTSLTIKNLATSALYNYTPYQPNAAALAFNENDPCASFGNLNFWVIYFDWFGNPATGVAPIGAYDTLTASGGALHVTGWALDQTSLVAPAGIRIQVTNPSGSITTVNTSATASRPDVATLYPLAGALHGIQSTLSASASGNYTVCVSALAAPGYSSLSTSLGCKSVIYSAKTGGSVLVDHLAGGDRYATSALIANAAYPDHADVVYVATGDNYPDALSAAPAAVAEHAPLLLASAAVLPQSVATEIAHLTPKDIVVVGGPTTISADVFSQLSRLASRSTIRIAGADRFETSRLVTAHAFKGSVAKAFVATGLNFPDALSASAVAAGEGSAVILVQGTASGVDPATTKFINDMGIAKVTVVGDEYSVSAAIKTQLAGQLGNANVGRLSGADRFATSAAINRVSFTSATNVYFATGSKFPDALAGAALAGTKIAPLYVVGSDCVPAYDIPDVMNLGVTHLTLLGDTNSLSANVEKLVTC